MTAVALVCRIKIERWPSAASYYAPRCTKAGTFAQALRERLRWPSSHAGSESPLQKKSMQLDPRDSRGHTHTHANEDDVSPLCYWLKNRRASSWRNLEKE